MDDAQIVEGESMADAVMSTAPGMCPSSLSILCCPR
jgi:hypothetical protein